MNKTRCFIYHYVQPKLIDTGKTIKRGDGTRPEAVAECGGIGTTALRQTLRQPFGQSQGKLLSADLRALEKPSPEALEGRLYKNRYSVRYSIGSTLSPWSFTS